MQLHVYNTEEEVIRGMADFFVATVNAAVKKNGKCTVVLSGGNSPKRLYELLASAYNNKIDWNRIFFFFGDERYVPFNDPANNGVMAKSILFDPLKIDDSQIFYIGTTLSPEHDAANYTDSIFTYFNDRPPRFDLVLLGLGDNAHTASLFPHTAVLYEEKTLIRSLYIEEQKAYRITMTASLINEAHVIAFLVFGKEKADAVYHVLKGQRNIESYPAQLIKPLDGSVNWFMDIAATSKIELK